jgi:rubrerythrin
LRSAAGQEAGAFKSAATVRQATLCERLENGESMSTAAALIRQQAHEIDDLWDRLSRAYALVRRESPAEMIQEEMEQLRAMLDERRDSQFRKTG